MALAQPLSPLLLTALGFAVDGLLGLAAVVLVTGGGGLAATAERLPRD